jgi:hypothetical protein
MVTTFVNRDASTAAASEHCASNRSVTDDCEQHHRDNH